MAKTTFTLEDLNNRGGASYITIETSGDGMMEVSVGYAESTRRASITHLSPQEARALAGGLRALATAAEASK